MKPRSSAPSAESPPLGFSILLLLLYRRGSTQKQSLPNSPALVFLYFSLHEPSDGQVLF
ncbi:hypothetical protein I41_45220 [Lacipirellula limnantheis]|uniref:Uncharacterized protein n=1 Tax=Lacipirellula limnantheis TaxID=2528024 RepID=A0A517U3V7_9BACT|nr:hypothetical protein I41_45220 [Lacipirellula limnantheis]